MCWFTRKNVEPLEGLASTLMKIDRYGQLGARSIPYSCSIRKKVALQGCDISILRWCTSVTDFMIRSVTYELQGDNFTVELKFLSKLIDMMPQLRLEAIDFGLHKSCASLIKSRALTCIQLNDVDNSLLEREYSSFVTLGHWMDYSL